MNFFGAVCVMMYVWTYAALALKLHITVGLSRCQVATDVFAYRVSTCESCLCACLYGRVHHLFWISICVHHLSFPLSLHLSRTHIFLFVYIVVNMPKQLVCTVYLPVHMVVANVEVPACTASFLTFCCSFIPSQEKVFKNSWRALLFFFF